MKKNDGRVLSAPPGGSHHRPCQRPRPTAPRPTAGVPLQALRDSGGREPRHYRMDCNREGLRGACVFRQQLVFGVVVATKFHWRRGRATPVSTFPTQRCQRRATAAEHGARWITPREQKCATEQDREREREREKSRPKEFGIMRAFLSLSPVRLWRPPLSISRVRAFGLNVLRRVGQRTAAGPVGAGTRRGKRDNTPGAALGRYFFFALAGNNRNTKNGRAFISSPCRTFCNFLPLPQRPKNPTPFFLRGTIEKNDEWTWLLPRGAFRCPACPLFLLVHFLLRDCANLTARRRLVRSRMLRFMDLGGGSKKYRPRTSQVPQLTSERINQSNNLLRYSGSAHAALCNPRLAGLVACV